MMAARFRLLLLLAAAAEAVHSTAAMAGAEKIMESLEVVASRNATVSFPATKADGPRSYYVARASGPALVAGVVERAGARLRATFDAPLAGRYFVEVLRLVDAIDAAAVLENRTRADDWPCANRPPDATVFAGFASFAAAPGRPSLAATRGSAWINGGGGGGFARTRYQVCGHETCERAYCDGLAAEAVDAAQGLARFAPYRWSAAPPADRLAFRPRNDTGARRGPSVCLVGASHARKVCDVLFRCRYVESLYARDVHEPAFVRNLLAAARATRCRVVATWGQWEAAAVGDAGARGFATPLRSFAADLDAFCLLATSLTRRPVWLMTTGYSPLGCIRLWCVWLSIEQARLCSRARRTHRRCPALDHRLPPVADAYNAVLRRVAAKHAPRVGVVDNEPIVGPVWDAAPDWCHEQGRVLDAIATNVVATIKADVAAWADDDGGGAW